MFINMQINIKSEAEAPQTTATELAIHMSKKNSVLLKMPGQPQVQSLQLAIHPSLLTLQCEKNKTDYDVVIGSDMNAMLDQTFDKIEQISL